jgi:hypothetical protein
MDPYEYTQTVNEERHDDDQDDLKKLEQDLAPTAADYYGVLNISRKVKFIKSVLHFIFIPLLGYRRRN